MGRPVETCATRSRYRLSMTERRVELVPVTDEVLDKLVQVAVRGAHPNEVTPPLSPNGSDEWTSERVEWLRAFHMDRRHGLAGPAHEATWAVVVDGTIVGSVRLKVTAREGCLEMGAWLGRVARGRGIGRQALAALVEQAVLARAKEVCAETTTANIGALAVLRHLNFEIEAREEEAPPVAGRPKGMAVRARLCLPG